MDPIVSVIVNTLLIIIGLYLIIEGFLILVRNKIYLGPTIILGLWFLRLLKGPEAEARKRSEFTTSSRMKTGGIYLLTFGFSLLILVIFNIFR
jgi:hypothetical protein